MNPYWRLLLLLTAALLGAFAWSVLSDDPGYLLVTFHGWSVETTLIVAVLLLGLGVLALRLLWMVARAPLHFWQLRRRQQARERLAGGLLALAEGRWARAEKLLSRAASDPAHRQAALLFAADAALARGDSARAERLLGQAGNAGAEAAVMAFNAARMLAAGQPAAASELLDAAARAGELSPRAQETRVRALAECGRAADALSMLGDLRSSRVRDGAALQELEADVASAALQQARSADELGQHWSALSRVLRTHARVVVAYAQRAQQLGRSADAARGIEGALEKHWDDGVAGLYGKLDHAAPRQAIKQAERWLQEHPDSAGALLALGRLCRREQLWGKAEDFLNRALTADPAAAWEALGELWLDRNDHGRAHQALQNALHAQRQQATTPLRAIAAPERVDTAVEERDAMGLPRLPAP